MTYNDFLCCVMQTKSNTCFSITKATMTQPLSVKTSIESSIVVHNTRKENGMLIGLIGNYMIGNMFPSFPSIRMPGNLEPRKGK